MKSLLRFLLLAACLGQAAAVAADPPKASQGPGSFTLVFEKPISVLDALSQLNAKLPGLPHSLNIPPVIEAELYGAIESAISEDIVRRQERRDGHRAQDLDVEKVECQRYIPLQTVISSGMIPAGRIHAQVDEFSDYPCPDSPLSKLKDRRAYRFFISFMLISDLKAFKEEIYLPLEEDEMRPDFWIRHHLYLHPAQPPADVPKKPDSSR